MFPVLAFFVGMFTGVVIAIRASRIANRVALETWKEETRPLLEGTYKVAALLGGLESGMTTHWDEKRALTRVKEAREAYRRGDLSHFAAWGGAIEAFECIVSMGRSRGLPVTTIKE